ncbi:MAG: hypothetical protein ACO1SV_12225 [Fimbriimonas sp.]
MAGFARLGANLTTGIFNAVLDALELWAMRQGKGVLSGLELSAGTGLEVEISAGSLLGLKAVSIDLQTFALGASQTRYIWIDEAGAVTSSSDDTDPGGTSVCLGLVTTSGSAVTLITKAGRMETARWVDRVFRVGAGRLEVDPEAQEVRVLGRLVVNGHILRPVADHELDADLDLPASWPNVVWLTPDAPGRKVILPVDPEAGLDFELHNAGSGDILVRDPSDANTLATLTPGDYTIARPVVVAGVPEWPASLTVL